MASKEEAVRNLRISKEGFEVGEVVTVEFWDRSTDRTWEFVPCLIYRKSQRTNGEFEYTVASLGSLAIMGFKARLTRPSLRAYLSDLMCSSIEGELS